MNSIYTDWNVRWLHISSSAKCEVIAWNVLVFHIAVASSFQFPMRVGGELVRCWWRDLCLGNRLIRARLYRSDTAQSCKQMHGYHHQLWWISYLHPIHHLSTHAQSHSTISTLGQFQQCLTRNQYLLGYYGTMSECAVTSMKRPNQSSLRETYK